MRSHTTHGVVSCYLKVDIDYVEMYIMNSRLITSLKESINDTKREKKKMESHKTEGGKEWEGETNKSEASRKMVDTILAISILILNMNGLSTLFNCQADFKIKLCIAYKKLI